MLDHGLVCKLDQWLGVCESLIIVNGYSFWRWAELQGEVAQALWEGGGGEGGLDIQEVVDGYRTLRRE